METPAAGTRHYSRNHIGRPYQFSPAREVAPALRRCCRQIVLVCTSPARWYWGMRYQCSTMCSTYIWRTLDPGGWAPVDGDCGRPCFRCYPVDGQVGLHVETRIRWGRNRHVFWRRSGAAKWGLPFSVSHVIVCCCSTGEPPLVGRVLSVWLVCCAPRVLFDHARLVGACACVYYCTRPLVVVCSSDSVLAWKSEPLGPEHEKCFECELDGTPFLRL